MLTLATSGTDYLIDVQHTNSITTIRPASDTAAHHGHAWLNRMINGPMSFVSDGDSADPGTRPKRNTT
jgi:hypothetical protein